MGTGNHLAVIRYGLDGSCRRFDDGRVLIGGSPLRLFRLSPGGAKVVDAVAAGAAVGDLPAGHEPLTTRLLDAGAIHPLLGARSEQDFEYSSARDPARLTVVVPAYRGDDGADLEGRIGRIITACAPARVVVVDDASPRPLGPVPGAEVVRLAVNGGPGIARQHGLDRVTTPFVAFVDTDVELRPGWLVPLLAHFDDPRVGLVAPRVQAEDGPGRLARFEAVRSPLDLGPDPARVRAGTRVSYLPAAALVARVDAVRAVGGFDPLLRWGEDVDLVWRLDEAGWWCRYEPAVTVHHATRPTLSAWLSQRRAYGRSATPLARRHPGALAPVRVSAWSAAAWGLGAMGAPVTGAVVAAGSTAALVPRLPEFPGRTRAALRLAGLGHLHAGRLLAEALTRSWWPLALAGALVSRRVRRAVAVALVVPALVEWWRSRHRIDPVTYLALRVADDAAYGTGVWDGARAARRLDVLVPDLTSWPRDRGAERRRPARARR